MQSGSEVALQIKPKAGTINANGVYRTFAVAAGDQFDTTMKVIAVDGGSFDFGITLKFKKPNGTVVQTKSMQKTVKAEHVLGLSEVVPVGATQVQVAVGANHPSDGTVMAMYPWWVGTADAPTSNGQCDPPDCPECEISCPAGTHLVNYCSQRDAPACSVFQDCYCADDDDGDTELMQGSNWSDW